MRTQMLLTTAGLVLLGTLTLAQNVTFDFDRAADFTKFKSYTWVRGTDVSDELNHKRVVAAVESQLTGKGLMKVATTDNPDLLVAYHATFDRDLQINGFSSGWGGYRFPGSRSGTARVEEMLVGTLVVDIVDAHAKTIVWRGTATKDIDVRANGTKREKNINKAAEKLFKNYPPRDNGR